MQTPLIKTVHARQIAFVCAFLLPCAKLLEVPALLAKYAKGDLLLPALLHFLLQSGLLAALLLALRGSERTLRERLRLVFGKADVIFYILYALYFLFYALLPILDLEKFTYAAFSDTEPTIFTFGFFFLLSAFVCAKSLRGIGRFADLSLFLFLVPFLALIGMSLFEADLSGLLPLFGTKFGDSMYAFSYTTPHFSDVALLLPLLLDFKPKKGDESKILAGYGVGAVLSLLLFAVFFGVFSSIAPREHYAFSKIAQYFPALAVVGRFDLIFVYMLSVVLLVYTCLPLVNATDCICYIFKTKRRAALSLCINLPLFLFALYANRRYNFFYALISGNLPFLFWLIADLLPLLLLFLPKKRKEKEALHA